MNRLENRRALITGGAQGLGLACARRFLQEGASVLLADINAEQGEKTRAELSEYEGRIAFMACDVAQKAQIDAAFDHADQLWGGIDILVNNAGIAVSADILTMTEDLYDRVMSINLRAAVWGTQSAAKRMIKHGKGGAIINMSSVNAKLNIPHLISYNIAKGGLNQLTANSAIALAPHGIRVNGIGPGTIMTDLLRGAVWTDAEARRSILSRTPLGRAGEPDEIGSIAAFLASDDASYVTGQTIYADGGRLGLNYTVPVT